MSRLAGCSEKSSGTQASDDSLRPKRGAFPTPKTEIDKAKPYIPEAQADKPSVVNAPSPEPAAQTTEERKG